MAFYQENLAINSVDKLAPMFLCKMNKDICEEFNQLNTVLQISLKLKTSSSCNCHPECQVTEKLVIDITNRLAVLRSRCCFLYKRSLEYYKSQIDNLTLENDALRIALIGEKSMQQCKNMM